MPNITLAIDNNLLKKGREYARKHRTTLNGLVRNLLSENVAEKSGSRLEEAFRLADKAKCGSRGKKWRREELYDV